MEFLDQLKKAVFFQESNYIVTTDFLGRFSKKSADKVVFLWDFYDVAKHIQSFGHSCVEHFVYTFSFGVTVKRRVDGHIKVFVTGDSLVYYPVKNRDGLSIFKIVGRKLGMLAVKELVKLKVDNSKCLACKLDKLYLKLVSKEFKRVKRYVFGEMVWFYVVPSYK